MKLSVVIPVYNEERTIKAVVDKIRKVNIEKEIIIVDDCSKDKTKEILKIIEDKYKDIKIIYNNPNRGKGYVVKCGFNFATGDVILIQDADLEYDPNDYFKLMKPFLETNAPVVYGSRFLGKCENMIFPQVFANKLFNLLTNLIHHSNLTDTCTCYKAFRADIIKALPLDRDGFEICHEINAKLLKKYNVIEVPINYSARTKKEGKKVDWRVFFTSIYVILKYGFFND